MWPLRSARDYKKTSARALLAACALFVIVKLKACECVFVFTRARALVRRRKYIVYVGLGLLRFVCACINNAVFTGLWLPSSIARNEDGREGRVGAACGCVLPRARVRALCVVLGHCRRFACMRPKHASRQGRHHINTCLHTRLRHMLDSSIGGADESIWYVSCVDIYDYRVFAGVKLIPYRSLTERAAGPICNRSVPGTLQLSSVYY